MGIDLTKMKERLSQVQNKGNGESVFWRPNDGEQTIRIVPTSDGDPFKDYWFHYNLGENPGFLSPKKNFGEDDPLDSFVRDLFNENTDDSVKMAKDLMARRRFFSPVVVRGEEHKGVRLWGYGKTAYEKLLGLVLNPEYGDITDPEAGTDLIIGYGKPAGASFPQTSITPRRKSTPLCDDEDRSREMLDNIPEFEKVFTRKTPEEVGVMLDEYLSSEEQTEESSLETVYGDAKENVSEVDSAFKDLLSS